MTHTRKADWIERALLGTLFLFVAGIGAAGVLLVVVLMGGGE